MKVIEDEEETLTYLSGTKDVTVFVPMPTSYEGIWIGYVPSLEELTKQYNVDKV